MIKLQHIPKDQGKPDWRYIMPNRDQVDILVDRSGKNYKYTVTLPAPHGTMIFEKMAALRKYLFENFET